MPFNNTLLDLGGTQMRTSITHIGLHSALPDANGSNPANSARQPAGWGAVTAGGDFSTSNLNFTGGTPNGAVTHVGFWSSAGTGTPPTTGTFYGSQALTGDPTFNSAGEYTVTSITVTGTSP